MFGSDELKQIFDSNSYKNNFDLTLELIKKKAKKINFSLYKVLISANLFCRKNAGEKLP